MINFKVNGYIVQKDQKEYYRGIDGDNWYLNYCSNNLYYEKYHENYIDKAWQDELHVDCCYEDKYIKSYIQESEKLGIKYRILLCLTDKEEPQISEKMVKQGIFLGYDYAYSGGSYYSSIRNDIVSKRIEDFIRFNLNHNGLFDTLEETKEFILFRSELNKMSSKYILEDGDFVIYKLYELDPSIFQ